MSLWKIAWRSIQQRALASGLTAFSMALGVALVVAVLVILGVVDQSFRRSSQGYDLIIGAKGSPRDLVLSTVYHLGKPTDSIPYAVYDDLVNGQFAPDIDVAVPVCLGDAFKGFRVIGTTPDMFDRLEYLDGRKYEFAPGGENFGWDGTFEAVLGAKAARKTGLKVGDKFRPVHGTAAEGGKEHDQRTEFTVVGVLASTGTPNDRALFVNIEGFYHLHTRDDESADQQSAGAVREKTKKDAKQAPAKEKPGAGASHDHDAIPYEAKRITAVLMVVKTPNQARRVALPKLIARELEVQAVAPATQVTELLEGLVGDLQLILLFLAVLIVVVAGIGILVSIYNSMSDRRHEIAVLRALGAKRRTVMLVVLWESMLLALGGGGIGLVLGHGLTGALGPTIADRTGVAIDPFQFQAAELILIPGLILLAAIVGYLPAVVAYRTDVAQSLIASP